MTKAQEVYEKVNTLIEAGSTRPDAFKQVASEYEQPVDSIRGSYYSYSRGATGGGSSRPDAGRPHPRTLWLMPVHPSNAPLTPLTGRSKSQANERPRQPPRPKTSRLQLLSARPPSPSDWRPLSETKQAGRGYTP